MTFSANNNDPNGGSEPKSSPNVSFSHPALSYALVAVLVLLGLALFKDFYTAQVASASWTKARGVVTDTNVKCRRQRVCNAYISYTYNADGAEYSRRNVEVLRNQLDGGVKLSETLERQYQKGRSLDVFYNPKRPGQSNLGSVDSPSIVWSTFFLLLGFAAYKFRG